jgi:4a-hydroxytetrahydrobiopterin dehydratase
MQRLAESAIQEKLRGVPGWEREGDAIRRTYAFDGFKSAMAFVNRVAALADARDHHPDILVQYSRVTLTLSTHDAGGLTDRDFALAREVDAA